MWFYCIAGNFCSREKVPCVEASHNCHNCIVAMARKTFTNHEKLSFLSIVKERRAKGESLRSIARSLHVQPKQLRQWAASSAQLTEAPSTAKTVRTAKSKQTGRKSSLANIEEELVSWIAEMGEKGKTVSIKLAVQKASELDPTFRHKSEKAKQECLRYFFRAQKSCGERISTTDEAKASIEKTNEEDCYKFRCLVTAAAYDQMNEYDVIYNPRLLEGTTKQEPLGWINVRSLRTLNPGSWLDDAAMNTLMYIATKDRPDILLLDHYLYTNWKAEPGKYIARIHSSRRVKVTDLQIRFQKKNWLQAINKGNMHWQLLAVQFTPSLLSGEQPTCHFMLMDSFYGPSPSNSSDVEKYVRELVQFLWTKSFPGRPGISINKIVVTPPKQRNDFDCGIFTLLNATCIVAGNSPTNCSDWYTSDQGSAHRAVARQQFLDFINR
jgi:Ulp1 family protease